MAGVIHCRARGCLLEINRRKTDASPFCNTSDVIASGLMCWIWVIALFSMEVDSLHRSKHAHVLPVLTRPEMMFNYVLHWFATFNATKSLSVEIWLN